MNPQVINGHRGPDSMMYGTYVRSYLVCILPTPADRDGYRLPLDNEMSTITGPDGPADPAGDQAEAESWVTRESWGPHHFLVGGGHLGILLNTASPRDRPGRCFEQL